MGRMGDLFCIQQGQPTLHDMAKALGLKHDESRTTEGTVRAIKKAKKKAKKLSRGSHT